MRNGGDQRRMPLCATHNILNYREIADSGQFPGPSVGYRRSVLAIGLCQGHLVGWWARVGSNHGPPRCERGALPLSYAPGNEGAVDTEAHKPRPSGVQPQSMERIVLARLIWLLCACACATAGSATAADPVSGRTQDYLFGFEAYFGGFKIGAGEGRLHWDDARYAMDFKARSAGMLEWVMKIDQSGRIPRPPRRWSGC